MWKTKRSLVFVSLLSLHYSRVFSVHPSIVSLHSEKVRASQCVQHAMRCACDREEASAIMRSLLVLALCIAMSAVAQAQTCPAFSGQAYFNMTYLIGLGCPEATTCATSWCSCLGGSIATGTCSQLSSFMSTSPLQISCNTAPRCYQRAVSCVITAASNARSGTTTCTNWGMGLTTAQLLALASPMPYSSSDVYKACVNFACNDMNSTFGMTCNTSLPMICTNYSTTPLTQPPGVTFAPLTPITRSRGYRWMMSIPGQWTLFFSQSASFQQSAVLAMARALSMRIGYPVQVIRFRLGSLETEFAASVPEDDTATQQQVTSNVAQINSDTSTNWLAPVQAVMATVPALPQIQPPLVSAPAITSEIGLGNLTFAPYGISSSVRSTLAVMIAVIAILAHA